MKNKAITSRDVDFAKWYTDIVREAHLADYSGVKGCIVFEPNGYAIWEKMQKVLDEKFKALGHQNVYLPLLIPESLMRKESELIEGFAPEGAWVTEGGKNKLEERMIIRPTSETLFSDYYSGKVKSYKDLPLLYNQWCNVMRWEKETRPFLRTREFLWQEGHTVHASEEEAKAETDTMLNVYKDFFENYLAIPVIILQAMVWIMNAFHLALEELQMVRLIPQLVSMQFLILCNFGMVEPKICRSKQVVLC